MDPDARDDRARLGDIRRLVEIGGTDDHVSGECFQVPDSITVHFQDQIDSFSLQRAIEFSATLSSRH